MPGPGHGTRFDARIETGIRRGETLVALAARLRVSQSYVGQRGHSLGLSKLIRANGVAAQARNSVGGGIQASHWRKLAAEIGCAPGDQLVSDVARSLRKRPADLSDAAVAALHERGLTVDELCEGTRRPAWMIVRAVREAARCL